MLIEKPRRIVSMTSPRRARFGAAADRGLLGGVCSMPLKAMKNGRTETWHVRHARSHSSDSCRSFCSGTPVSALEAMYKILAARQ